MLKNTTIQADRIELLAAGNKGGDTSDLYVFGDQLGSTIWVQDTSQREVMRLGYSPFGQPYRKVSDNKFWKLNSGVNANNQLNQLMPYQYTGRYTEGATGYTNLDARWYNPYTQRFNQPDYWNFSHTGLPKAVQHELMRFTGLNTTQLLRDPAQQMRYGYVAGNPLNGIDFFGLEDMYDGKISFEIQGEFGEKAQKTLEAMLTNDEYSSMVDEVYEKRGQLTIDERMSDDGSQYVEETNTISLSTINNFVYPYQTEETEAESEYLDSIDDVDEWSSESQRIDDSHSGTLGFSLERKIFHETYHGLQSGADYGFNPGPYESDAIKATNPFMSDTYGEPYRSEVHTDIQITNSNQRTYHECP